MSQQYDNTNKGVLFVNDRKDSESHPDLKGSINIDGKEYWLSAWNAQTSKGETLRLSVKPKEAHAKSDKRSSVNSYRNRRDAPQSSAPEDDIPW